jgi:hypothetical protein
MQPFKILTNNLPAKSVKCASTDIGIASDECDLITGICPIPILSPTYTYFSNIRIDYYYENKLYKADQSNSMAVGNIILYLSYSTFLILTGKNGHSPY